MHLPCNLCNCNVSNLWREAAAKKVFLHLHTEICASTMLVYTGREALGNKIFDEKGFSKPIDFVSKEGGDNKVHKHGKEKLNSYKLFFHEF